MVNRNAGDQAPPSAGPNIPVPKYFRVKEAVLTRIANGLWPAGTTIPSEVELGREFGVSRITVRKAIGDLVHEGKLMTIQGKGTFVARPKLQERFLQRAFGFFEDMEQRGLRPTHLVLRQEVVAASPDVAAHLGVAAGTGVHLLVRVHCAEGEKIYVSTSHILSELCPGLADEDLTSRSLYRLLRERYGISIARAERSFEAVSAGPWEARLLDIALGSPILRVDNVAFLPNGRAFEYSWALQRGDRVRVEVEVVPPAVDPMTRG